MNEIVAAVGLIVLSVGVGLFDWRAGLCVFGLGLVLDAAIPRAK